MKVVVSGPGAIGGLIASRLLDAGHDVTLIARDSAGAARIRRRGLAVGRRRIKGWASVTEKLPARTTVDAIFLCVKSPAIRRAIECVRPGVGPETAVISLLNGVTHLAPVRRAFGPRRAVFGSCYIAAMRNAAGAIQHSGGEHILLARGAKNSAALKTAASLLSAWKVKTVGSEERLLWTKLLYNAAVNPLGALLDRDNGALATDPALRDLVRLVLKEAVDIATRAGHRPLHADMEARVARGCLAVPRQINSMAQDLRAGRETEADAILKPLLDAAQKQGRRATAIEPLYRVLKRLEGHTP